MINKELGIWIKKEISFDKSSKSIYADRRYFKGMQHVDHNLVAEAKWLDGIFYGRFVGTIKYIDDFGITQVERIYNKKGLEFLKLDVDIRLHQLGFEIKSIGF